MCLCKGAADARKLASGSVSVMGAMCMVLGHKAQASHLGLASCMKRLIWMATLSFWQSQYPACTPIGSHDFVAKLVDSAQLKPWLKPEW